MGAARAVPLTGVCMRVRGSQVRVAGTRILLRGCERPGQLGGRQPLLVLPHGLPARPSSLEAAPSFWRHEERLWLGLVVLRSLRGHRERCRLYGCLITEVVSEGNQFRCFFYFTLVSVVFSSLSDAKVLCLLKVKQEVPVCS